MPTRIGLSLVATQARSLPTVPHTSPLRQSVSLVQAK
jgi:hypothetical protein